MSNGILQDYEEPGILTLSTMGHMDSRGRETPRRGESRAPREFRPGLPWNGRGVNIRAHSITGALLPYFVLCLALAWCSSTLFAETEAGKGAEEELLEDAYADPFEKDSETAAQEISDPLEKMNRVFFKFNDKLYFWVLRPVAKGYSKVVPQTARVGVKRFFTNAASPVRLVNCLLQGKGHGAKMTLYRFAINTTVGVAGFRDPAQDRYHLTLQDEDLGQTFGKYGLGNGWYLNWPVLGPSTVRDTIGQIGDGFLVPWPYLMSVYPYLGVRVYDRGVNETSLSLGDYEDFKKAAFDPYVSMRNAYLQNRAARVRE